MSAPLYLLKLSPRLDRLASWAYARALSGRDGELGYALHAALAAAFGADAPKPFRLREPRAAAAGGEPPALYGYAAADEAALRDRAAFAEPDVHAALGLATLAAKPMPTVWATGRKLDFEVRIRPVVRCDRPGDRRRVRERDAFLAALPPDPADGAGRVDREDVYRRWLERELARDGAAHALPGTLRMIGFQRTREQRRSRRDKPRRGGGSGHSWRSPEGPDALFTGTLEIVSGDAFAALIRRGVGRHRAFGFGMLLLRPGAGRAKATRC